MTGPIETLLQRHMDAMRRGDVDAFAASCAELAVALRNRNGRACAENPIAPQDDGDGTDRLVVTLRDMEGQS